MTHLKLKYVFSKLKQNYFKVNYFEEIIYRTLTSMSLDREYLGAMFGIAGVVLERRASGEWRGEAPGGPGTRRTPAY